MRAIRDMAVIILLASLMLVPCATSGAQTPAASPPPAAPPAATPPAPAPAGTSDVKAGLPLKIGASVALRHEFSNFEDRADLLLPPNDVEGLLGRFRFWAESKDPNAFTSGGIRFSVGETPNPTVPFIRLGDGFRPQSFNLDQFYVTLRPFHDRGRLSGTFGKMPQPFWRGDRGTVRTELIWDDDVSPVGGSANLLLYKNTNEKRPIVLENIGGVFIIEWFRQNRFAGLTGDTYVFADQLHLKAGHFSAAATYYAYENLNSGAVAPSFTPNSSASLVPAQNAFLLRAGFQATNAAIEIGPGSHAFRSNRFRVVDLLGQIDVPLHIKSLGKPEVFVLGQYTHNSKVENNNTAWGVTAGFSGGDARNRWLRPFNIWGTYRNVEADATLATFADSDLGAGTDYKGFEIGGNYRLTKNVSGWVQFWRFDGSPRQSTRVRRLFFDLLWDF